MLVLNHSIISAIVDVIFNTLDDIIFPTLVYVPAFFAVKPQEFIYKKQVFAKGL